jgi:hypothetical protein
LKDLDIGYTDQPLAFEITQLKIYDTPRDKSDYLGYKTVKDYIKKCNYTYSMESFTKDYNDYYLKGSYSAHSIRDIVDNCKVKRSPQSFCRVIDTV